MHLAINTKPPISLLISQAHSISFSKAMTEHNKKWKFTITKEQAVLDSECITLMRVFNVSLTAASSSHSTENILSILQPKTPFSKNMMEDLKTLSRKFMNKTIKSNLKLKRSGMNID